MQLLMAHGVRRYLRRHFVLDAEKRDPTMPAPSQGDAELLYLHVPYCEALCPFCTFHRVLYCPETTRRYFGALRREIRYATDSGFSIKSLYVGGGTPTVLPWELARTVDLIRSLHPLESVSVETNPNHLNGEYLSAMLSAGVNRLSVGVQTFDDSLLKRIDRYDSYGSGDQIRRNLTGAAGKFDTLNVDMIFNLPGQSQLQLEKDLTILTEFLNVDQVSFYPFMVMPEVTGKVFDDGGREARRRERVFHGQIAGHMLAAGYTRSSAWCYARKGGMIDEYIVANDSFLGLGSGAFSFLGGKFYAETFSIENYLRLVESGRSGLIRTRKCSPKEKLRYYLLVRLFGGKLDLDEADNRFAGCFERELRWELSFLRLTGAVRKSGRFLFLTEHGNYLWVMLMKDFFISVDMLRDEMRRSSADESEGIAIA